LISNSRIKQLTLLTNNSLIGSAASYFLSIYIANRFGAEKYGLYSYILTLSSFSLIFINWSSDQTAPSYFSQGLSKIELFNLIIFTRFIFYFISSFVLLIWINSNVFIFFCTLALNISSFNLSFIFEITGRNSIYSYIYLFERLFYVLCVFLAIYFGFIDIGIIIGIYIFVLAFSFYIQYFVFERECIVTFSLPSFYQLFSFVKKNLTVVIVSFSSFVYGGISRIFIQNKIGLVALGLFSSGMQITVLASIFQAQVERIWRLPLYAAFSEKNSIKIKEQIYSFLKFTTLPTILLSILIYFLSDYIVDILFSNDYHALKELLPIIAFFFITININSLLNICWFALNKNREYLIVSILMSGLLLIIFIFLPQNTPLIMFLFYILLTQVLTILYSLIRIYSEIKHIAKNFEF
jgi:O-antigen/teichoic acid export membrane protein